MAKTLELTPLAAHIRVYAEGKSYANRDPYEGILTIMYLTNDTVYLTGAHGSVTGALRVKAMKLLASKGIKHVSYHRNNKLVEVEL